MAASFFEKLKKGMGAEIPETEEKIIEGPKKTKTPPKSTLPSEDSKVKKPKKLTIKAKSITPSEVEVEKETEEKDVKAPKEKWFQPEGQLAVDVYQNEGEIVIQSTIAGIKPDDLDISIENDVVTIRGSREKPDSGGEEKNYFYQECYWGPFSREIILPEEVDPSRIEATMKEGILTIKIPKIERKKKRKVVVKG